MRTRQRTRLQTYERTGSFRRRAAPVAPYLVLLLTLSLSTGLGILHNRWRAADRPDPVVGTARALLFPFQIATVGLQNSLADAWSSLFAGGRLARENAGLRAEVARLKLELERRNVAADEVARLRAALGFRRRVGRHLVPADVIGRDPSSLFDTITISRGARNGTGIGMIVRSADGLLGQVSDVGPFSAQVMLLSDIGSRVGGMAVRGGKARGVGIVQGAGRGRKLVLTYLRREDDVRPGDLVTTSGYGGIVPPGIPIGRVVSVATDPMRFLKEAAVAPAAALGSAREVFLLPEREAALGPSDASERAPGDAPERAPDGP